MWFSSAGVVQWQAKAFLLLVVAAVALLPAAQAQNIESITDDMRLQRILIRGLTRLYIEDYEGAVLTLKQGLDIRPDSPALLATMGKAQIGLGETTSARFYLERALSIDPDNVDIWRFLADVALETGDAPTAVSALREVVSLSPKEVAAQLDLIGLLIRLEQFEDALHVADEAVSRLGPQPEFLRKQALIQERLGRSDALGETLIRLIDHEPRILEHRYRHGALHMRMGAWARAAAAYEDILEIDPDQIEASRSLAVVLEQQGRVDEAATILSSLPVETEDLAESLSAEEKFFLGIDRETDAREQGLRRRLEIDDMDSEALVALATLMTAREAYSEAAALYRRHVDFDPRSLDSWISGIAAFVLAGAPQEALSFAEDGLMLFPGYLPIQIEQANALIGADRRNEARDLLSELITRATEEQHLNRIAALLSGLDG